MVSNACESGKTQELGLPSPGLPTGGSTEKGHEVARGDICGGRYLHKYVANLQAKKLSSSSRLEGAGKGAPGASWVGSRR